MAEFIESNTDDSNEIIKDSIYSSQVANRPNDAFHENSPLSERSPHLSSPLPHPFLSNSQYHPHQEAPSLRRSDISYDRDRPGTPALIAEGQAAEDGSRQFRTSLDDEDFRPAGYHRFNYAVDRRYRGGVTRDSSRAYPPPVAPPTSPSQLYSLLLQRNIRPSEYPTRDLRPQTLIPNHPEWNSMNYFHTKSSQNDYYQEFQERERTFYSSHYGSGRPRYEQYDHLDQRPFLNQNYTRLPYSMVRIQNSNDDDKQSHSMNGFTEDGEGNHECHDLRHSSVPTLDDPFASVDEFDQNGTLQSGTAEIRESNGVPNLGTIYQGEWPMHRAMWMSGPSTIGEKDPLDGFGGDDTESIMSFSSSTATMRRPPHAHQLGTKMEMVYSLLSMLGSCNREDMSRTLLEMSSNQDSCIAMRQSGCLPLLIQLLHGGGSTDPTDQPPSSSRGEGVEWAVREARRRASQALRNIVHAHPDDRRGRREARVLRLLEQVRDYSDFLRDLGSSQMVFSHNENLDLHPGPAIAALMKLSFDEEHRHAMCQLGGLQAIAELIQADHEIHGNTSDQFCVTVRRYAGMALTNLTFGDGTNKALLCSMKPFMQALVAQLHSPNEDLRQVTASVLRNLSWRADASSKEILREVGVVVTLMKASMEAQKESTLKSILSALWNLSAHCSMNKGDVCEVEGALEFLVSTLTYKSTANTLSIIENGGGILRNVSSHIAVREDYRAILRKHKCLQTLLAHLKSPSLTVVSNACGTLWNLSARCAEDQRALWEMGAVGMLRNLIHSKHKMISMGSSAALKNLLAARPEGMTIGLTTSFTENGHSNGGLTNMPSLLVRKQKALAADIDQNLAETCDNIDSPKGSPTPNGDCKKFSYETNGFNGLDRKPQFLSYLPGRMYHSINGQVGSPVRVPRSESKDSLGSTRSEPPHYKAQRERFKVLVNNNRTVPLDSKTVQERAAEWKERTNLPFEGNSNVVLQMFRHLQNTNNSSTEVKTNGHTELSDGEDKPAIRPNTLPPPRKSSIGRSNRFYDRKSLLNNLHQSQKENGFGSSRTNGYGNTVAHSSEQDRTENVDEEQLLEIPGNKRTVTNDKNDLMLNEQKKSELHYNRPIESDNVADNNIETKFRNVVMRRKKPLDSLSSSFSTISKDASDDASTDQTPLVVSRCSSLSSLTSCFQHSARSSWVSDVSQRTSALISPTDLPDSPGCSNPDEKHRIFEFTDKIPDADSLIRPRPAWPMGSLPSSDSLPSSVKRMSLDSDVFANSHSGDRSEHAGSLTTPVLEVPPPSGPMCSPVSPGKEYSSPESSSSHEDHQDNGKDHALLAACIHLGMPSHQKDRPINSTLHSKLSSLFPQSESPKSGIPIKMAQSFPAPRNENFPTKKLTGSFCDDNDNVLMGSKEKAQEGILAPQEGSAEPLKGISQAFLSKCLSVCKKYPALSQKSSFEQGKIKTAIPQIIRAENPNFDAEQHPKQLHIKSQSLPVYKGITATTSHTQQDSRPTTHGNSSSTEDNISEDNILSSSPSACDESEGMDSDDKSRMPLGATGDTILRSNRVKSRKSKANRRSMEIRVPSEQSSEDDNKNVFSSVAMGPCHVVSIPSSESEEKVKEDARTREKVSRGIIPDILEGAAYHDNLGREMDRRAQGGCIAKSSLSWNMTDSMELRRGALMIAAELEEGMEDFTHSSTSIDLENMKPPSCMGEMSMTSSGLSDLLSNGNGCYINGKRAVDRRRNSKRSKKISNSHRFVLKSVRQTIAKNLDVRHLDKPISASTSMENVSMKSSGTSDLIENVNPPSMLDDLSMTNSCASLNSISSDILESRSNSLADPRSNSEMFQRLNAAAAMVQVYSRELNNIMTCSMKSSCNSDCLDLVKPPSIFHDIAEVTVEDGTEILSDPLVSDFELEEELPHDDEPSVPSAETVHSALFPRLLDDSAENLNSSFEGDSFVDREHFTHKRVSALALEHHNSVITDDDMSSGFFSNLTNDDQKDDTLDITMPSPSPPVTRQGPRIVKPINRDTIRQMQEKKNAEKSVVKPIRGRGPTSRNLFQQVTSARIKEANKTVKAPSPQVSGVRPTRTSALRASQNKQQPNVKTAGRMSPRSFLSKPPVASRLNKTVVPKTSTPITVDLKLTKSEPKKPPPLVKQNTFVKDEAIPKVPHVEDQNTKAKALSPVTSESKLPDRKLNFSAASSNMSLQRNPQQKKSGIPTSPSSQSISDEKSIKKMPEKKSPSNPSFSSRTNSVSSQGAKQRPKEVASKISSLWRRSESSSSSAHSPGTDGSGDKIPGAARVANKGTASRPSPSAPQPKGITRSSTYEKMPKTANLNGSSKLQPKPPVPIGTAKLRKPPTTNTAKIWKRMSTPPTKSSGGPRIVKPVPKPNAITSKTLRQSGSFCPFNETRSYGISSGPPSYISSGRSYEDAKVSIPLVTGLFGSTESSDERKVDNSSCSSDHSRNGLSTTFNKNSDSGDSDGDQ